ncbi:hypothetical protein N7462_004909 [Penicillium macrosclerotiorum]|uniref:uncharacterized protein n=1 Tax=Penicillium macrosclerotiorum TaxID=303699 RepID=UPI002546F75F|nr:uncharacterized protein N7462_004909 [Penicillium macrosclerotiorum]KAJ5690517.1 hypothetical protein N7462_004909 [Penicillium macrosclerotiorum]
MISQWPEPSFKEGDFQDVSHFADIFELHCAKVFDHAMHHPSDTVSATYVMDLVSQAYRAVHCLGIQRKAVSCLDTKHSTASLRSKALEYRETQIPPSTEDAEAGDTADADAEDKHQKAVNRIVENFFNKDIDEEDEGEDEDWSEEESDTDDEYYEYHEESEDDEDERGSNDEEDTTEIIQGVGAMEIIEEDQEEDTLGLNTGVEEAEIPAPSVFLSRDQGIHERILDSLQSLPPPYDTSTPPMEAFTQTTPPSPDNDQHEVVAVTTVTQESTQGVPLTRQPEPTAQEVPTPETPTTESDTTERKASYDGAGLRRSLTFRRPGGVPQRVKTVCYRYVRKAMVPIRGKVH